MSLHLKKVLILPVCLLAACSSAFDNLLFSLVPRPQEPKDRPYEIKEVEFINPRDGTKLAGEITYPSSGDKFPAFVLISGHEDGTPPAGRDYEITGHKYFFVISDLLTRRGYAVLRFDNRGVGKSFGDYSTASDEEFASDAAAALRWLRKNSGLVLSKSGFLGHSQGGIKALIAASHEKPDYVVALAGLGVEAPTQFFVRQNHAINSAQGMESSKIEQINREIGDIIAILQTSKNLDEARLRIRDYAIESGITKDKEIRKLTDHFATNWWFEEVRRNPEDMIKSYDGPILALFGSKDLLVSASVNEAPVRKLMFHPHSDAYAFEGLNHLFQEARNGTGPYEYWEIETTIEEKVVDKIDLWTRSVHTKNCSGQAAECRVSAPSEAWCILQGESPCRVRSSQPPVSSVAFVA